MYIQIVKFKTSLTKDEVIAAAEPRMDDFRALPGLIQKYYYQTEEPGIYGGVYLWESLEAIKSYRQSELAATIPASYKIEGAPTFEILDVLFPLRD